MPEIILKKDCDRRLRIGHLWVFSNEIAEIRGLSLDGEIVDIRDFRGAFVGKGYLNRHSLISARILTYHSKEAIDREFFLKRIREAIERRERLFPDLRSVRLVYSEGDFLPGLIVDRYEDVISIQNLTLGMELWKDTICDILEEILKPRMIVERNEAPVRRLEGLEEKKGFLRGSGETRVVIEENGNRFIVDLIEGQKTGFFLDQRENRERLKQYVKGMRVLDCFCYSGGWSMYAAQGGAKEVLGVDASHAAVELAEENAKINGYSETCRFMKDDVFEFLKELEGRGERFDVIVLDPPAFVKSKKELQDAVRGYREINHRGMKLLNDGGILATSSCSYHVDRELFANILVKASKDAGRTALLLEYRSQGRDHPVLMPMRETEYLKCAFVEVGKRP
jgi:23S rRNA (cytosine1962-C5)-methyltransferase